MEKKDLTIDKIKDKLMFVNQLFLDRQVIDKILATVWTTYKPSHLVQKWLLSVVKRWKVYVNTSYPKKPRAESIMWIYFKWTDYMFWGVNLYNQYGFTTQQAQWIEVYNTRTSGKRKIAGHRFIFKRKWKWFFRWRERKDSQGIKYYVMTRERALIQLLVDKKGIIEFEQDIFEQLNSWAIDVIMLRQLWDMYLSKKNKVILEKFIARWLKN